MSQQTIADVGRTLISLLRAELTLAPDRIALTSPPNAVANDVRLGLFLYKIVETPYLANEEDQTVVPPGGGLPISVRSPLTVTLHYVLTAYGAVGEPDLTAREAEAHAALSRAMRVFYDNGILAGSQLQAELAGTGHELRVSINPITMEDMTRIWSVFPDSQYSSSVAYIVTPVPIESDRTSTPSRVVDSEFYSGEPQPEPVMVSP